MYSFQELTEIVAQAISQYSLPKEPGNLYEPISYILGIGGKRLRPTLALAACNVFSDNIENAIKPALAVEVFHNFTLVHDDIMDNADIRRGQVTIHKKWNDNTAILSGDAMTILAYRLLTQTPAIYLTPVLNIFNNVALGVCEGQQYDMDFESKLTVSSEDYMRMIELKTAVLLKGALQIGAVIGDASNKDIELVGKFGTNMGLAFQLQDDLLDIYGDEAIFGKSIGGDIIACKKTMLVIEMVKHLSEEELNEFWIVFNDKKIDRDRKISVIKNYYDKVDVKSIIEQKVNYLFSLAQKALEDLSPENGRKKVLNTILQKLVGRDS